MSSGNQQMLLGGGGGAADKVVTAKLWGAGGGAGEYPNGSLATTTGAGGYTEVTFTAKAGTTLKLKVGQGGRLNNKDLPAGTNSGTSFGDGGYGYYDGDVAGGGGGGYTGLFFSSVEVPNVIAMSGGGGGAGYAPPGAGGAGGGPSGQSSNGGAGGTQSEGGASSPDAGGAGTQFAGAPAGTQDGSGGGGGWWGGGGGGQDGRPGGGGSGRVTPSSPTPNITSISGTTYSGSGESLSPVGETPSNPDYTAPFGRGLPINNPRTHGRDGLAVITIAGVKTTYNYTGSEVTITV